MGVALVSGKEEDNASGHEHGPVGIPTIENFNYIIQAAAKDKEEKLFIRHQKVFFHGQHLLCTF